MQKKLTMKVPHKASRFSTTRPMNQITQSSSSSTYKQPSIFNDDDDIEDSSNSMNKIDLYPNEDSVGGNNIKEGNSNECQSFEEDSLDAFMSNVSEKVKQDIEDSMNKNSNNSNNKEGSVERMDIYYEQDAHDLVSYI